MRYRLYYNRSEDAPFIWSIDEGTQASEIIVREYRLHGCDAKPGVDWDAPRTSKETPRVWVEVEANLLRVEDGVAHFYGRWVDSGYPLREE